METNRFVVVEDLGSALTTPAFINAHTHLCMLAFRGIGGLASLEGNVVKDLYFRLEQNLEPEDVRAFTRLGAVEALMSGTGFVWEHYYFGDMSPEALQDVGLNGAIASTLQDIDGPGKHRTEKAWAETYICSPIRQQNETDLFRYSVHMQPIPYQMICGTKLRPSPMKRIFYPFHIWLKPWTK